MHKFGRAFLCSIEHKDEIDGICEKMRKKRESEGGNKQVFIVRHYNVVFLLTYSNEIHTDGAVSTNCLKVNIFENKKQLGKIH